MSAKATLTPYETITPYERRLITLLADIREAVGDPEGRLMQSELVEHCREMRKDAERMRWLLSGHGYFMEERGLCGHGPCDQDEQDRARKQIDEAMKL